MPAEPLSPLKQGRRDRLIDAAERVFQASGFRGASMEAIAREGSVSKATLYGYFPDKEATFVAVAERLAGRLGVAFEAALARDGDVVERVSQALIAKHRAVFATVRRFSEAADLFAAQARLGGDIFRNMDTAMVARLASALGEAGLAGADRLAAVLFAAAQGVANAGRPDTLDADLRLLAARLIGG